MSKGNLPLAEGNLEWADSVTVKPKAELLQEIIEREQYRFTNRQSVL